MSICSSLRGFGYHGNLLHLSAIPTNLTTLRPLSKGISKFSIRGISGRGAPSLLPFKYYGTFIRSSHESQLEQKTFHRPKIIQTRHVSGFAGHDIPRLASGFKTSASQTSLPLQGIKLNHKRVKWGILDPKLLETLDSLERDSTPQDSEASEAKNGASDLHGFSELAMEEDSKLNDMPLSPLVNPDLYQARRRYREPKSPPSREKTRFQTQLAKNPYGSTIAPRCVCGADL